MMERASDEILSKIKKLMALGESPSEAEAASALEKARVLLAKYGLSIADVETKESEVTENVLLEKKRLRSWESHLIFVVTRATFTQALHTQRGDLGQVLIIGREVNAIAAAELFAYLHLVVLKLGRAHSGSVQHLDSFKVGAVERIGERLAELDAEEESGVWGAEEKTTAKKKTCKRDSSDGHDWTDGGGATNGVGTDRALMVMMDRATERENRDYIESKYGKTKTKRTGRRVDAESYYRGRQAGEGVSLNRQLQ
jgi:hypothetical protein